MKRNEVIIVIVVLVAIGGLVLIFRLFDRAPHYNWTRDYSPQSDQPYGTLIFRDLLDGYFPTAQTEIISKDLQNIIEQPGTRHRTYMFVGEYPYYTDTMFNSLMEFVAQGNDIFISAVEIPVQFREYIVHHNNASGLQDTVYEIDEFGDSIPYFTPLYAEDKTALSGFYTSGITMNFIHPGFRTDTGYRFVHYVQDKRLPIEWPYFMPDYLQQFPDMEVLGTIQSQNFTNFIRIAHGDGFVYLHSCPQTFTNFYIIDAQKLDYTNKVLSYLKPGDILWDDYSRSYQVPDDNNDNQEEGPLRYILSQRSLRSAWYTLLAGLGLFLLFRTKRLQRPIPVLEPNENKSLDFVQTIGRMYFLRKNHKQLAHQKMRLFLHFVQDRYQIPSAVTDDAFMEKLQLKSEIGMQSIGEIFKHYQYIENTNDVTHHDIIELHRLLDHFYKHCK